VVQVQGLGPFVIPLRMNVESQQNASPLMWLTVRKEGEDF